MEKLAVNSFVIMEGDSRKWRIIFITSNNICTLKMEGGNCYKTAEISKLKKA